MLQIGIFLNMKISGLTKQLIYKFFHMVVVLLLSDNVGWRKSQFTRTKFFSNFCLHMKI